ncbi:MAG TPA: PHB depolymerase family esterase [Burkholderiaceae bacterium]
MSLHAISETIHRAFESAGLDPHSAGLKSVTETIHKALVKAGLAAAAPAGERSPAVSESAAESAAGAKGVGAFLSLNHAGPAGARSYKLFVPSSYRGKPMPLIVMLHGCQQHPDDFAAGTRMNELAERDGFLVAYPAQSSNANGSNCWNWYQARDQAREGGEPEIIKGIVDEIVGNYAVDKRRVFAAGMSAGAAMAVILGTTHADLFAAVGAHSGLPYGAAHDVASAFALMHGAGGKATGGPSVPIIVFHGDQDRTVVDSNADAIVRQAVAGFEAKGRRLIELQQVAPAGAASRAYTSTIYTGRDGRPLVEHWALKGGTHAWSGGSSRGSFTDEKGPDASAEMVRFFMRQ